MLASDHKPAYVWQGPAGVDAELLSLQSNRLPGKDRWRGLDVRVVNESAKGRSSPKHAEEARSLAYESTKCLCYWWLS